MNSTAAALEILNLLLANATQISSIIQKASAEGRTTFTDAEWLQITSLDDNGKKALSDAITKAGGSTGG